MPIAGMKMHLVRDAKTLEQLMRDSDGERASIDQCKGILTRVYSELYQAWYCLPTITMNGVPNEKFTDAFKQSAVENFQNVFIAKGIVPNIAASKFEIRDSEDRIYNVKNPIQYLQPRFLRPGPLIRSVTHGDLHPGNILVAMQSRNVSLIDFAYTNAETPVYTDFAHFEVYVIMDMLSRAAISLTMPQRLQLLELMFDGHDLTLNLQSTLGRWPKKLTIYGEMLSHNRYELLETFGKLHQSGTYLANTLLSHYLSLVFYYLVIHWNWIGTDPIYLVDDLVFNLVSCSKIIQNCSDVR
jgi:hypothetical protein